MTDEELDECHTRAEESRSLAIERGNQLVIADHYRDDVRSLVEEIHRLRDIIAGRRIPAEHCVTPPQCKQCSKYLVDSDQPVCQRHLGELQFALMVIHNTMDDLRRSIDGAFLR